MRARGPEGRRRWHGWSGLGMAAVLLVSGALGGTAAARRGNALKVRLDAGLTGGDVRDGALAGDAFGFGLGILVAVPAASPPARTVTQIAPPSRSGNGRATVTRAQLLTNQRISQAAVRRTNALRDRLARGLAGTDFRDASVTAVDFGASALP